MNKNNKHNAKIESSAITNKTAPVKWKLFVLFEK